MTHREDRRPDDLSLLDPGRADPGYWERLRAGILSAVAFELAARRQRARMSVTGVLSGWSSKLIPATLVAAAAALLVWSESRWGSDGEVVQQPPLVLEEVLSAGAEGGLPWAAQGVAANSVAFMSFVEGQSR